MLIHGSGIVFLRNCEAQTLTVSFLVINRYLLEPCTVYLLWVSFHVNNKTAGSSRTKCYWIQVRPAGPNNCSPFIQRLDVNLNRRHGMVSYILNHSFYD